MNNKPEKPVSIYIILAPEDTVAARAAKGVIFAVTFMALPVVNHHLLSGNIVLDVLLIAFALIVAGAAAARINENRSRRVDTPEDAAAWVKRRGWEDRR